MIRRILPLLLLATAGCAADRMDAAAEIPAAASALAAADSSPPSSSSEAYLVWSGDSASARTAWIDGSGRVVAERPGIYVAGGGTVWAWTPGMKKGRWIDCECLRNAEFAEDSATTAQCRQDAEVRVADLVDVAGGRRIEVLTGESDDAISPPEQRATPLTGVGPYLFVEFFHDIYACGAHGFGGASPGVYDLRTGEQVVLIDTVNAAPYVLREGEVARAALAAEEEDTTVEVGPVDLTEVEVRWTPEGELKVAYQFTISACYACSDGEFGSYSRSESVPAREVIPALQPYLRAPEAVRRYWAQSPPGERAGWSAVDAADPAAALARFRGR
jgi:hypothetical protein